MKFEGNPFFWGFSEQRAIETLAKRAQATYNEPREVVEQHTALENYFCENFSTSPNPAFVTGGTAIEPMPYLMNVSNNSSEDVEKTEDDVLSDETITDDNVSDTTTDVIVNDDEETV